MHFTTHPLLPYLTSPLNVALPSGESVEVARCSCSFKLWQGKPIADTYGGKAVLDFEGQPVFAEIAILLIMQKAGWDGVWVDTYRKKFRQTLPPAQCSLPAHAQAVFDSIKVKGWRGWFDIFTWMDGHYLFLELKRVAKDRIRPNQRAWLQAALEANIKADSFLIVEWQLAT